MSVFNVFFDSPAKRPYASASALDPKGAKVYEPDAARADRSPLKGSRPVRSPGARDHRLSGAPARPRRGGRLRRSRRTGRFSTTPAWSRRRRPGRTGLDRHRGAISPRRGPATRPTDAASRSATGRSWPRPTAARSRASRRRISIFFPRDYTDNLKTVWYGSEPPRARTPDRVRHPPDRDRRRQLRPLVQRPARHRAAAGRLLSPQPGNGRGRARARSSGTPTATASPSFPAASRSPATGTWRSRSPP